MGGHYTWGASCWKYLWEAYILEGWQLLQIFMWGGGPLHLGGNICMRPLDLGGGGGGGGLAAIGNIYGRPLYDEGGGGRRGWFA